MHRSKSVSSMGESASTSIRNWWDWGRGWILSRKPVFGPDLEFNKSSSNGSNGGSWKSVLLKVRSEIRKMVRSDKVGLSGGGGCGVAGEGSGGYGCGGREREVRRGEGSDLNEMFIYINYFFLLNLFLSYLHS
ncbi:hypothetical protein Hdeb2414_s0005g00159021 [Helianthus debilis subsp. tardiflorus]